MSAGASGSGKELQGIVPLAKFTTLVRIILPSCLATTIVYRTSNLGVDLLSILRGKTSWTEGLSLIALFLFCAVVVYFSSDKLYEVYEGRSLWPSWLTRALLRLQKWKVRMLLEKAGIIDEPGKSLAPPWPERTLLWLWRIVKQLLKKAKTADERALEIREAWSKLRMYPQDENGRPAATYPTALGNLLAAYEAYPLTRYGMDSVFYWPRLWLLLDTDRKEAVDNQWAVADGLVSLSAVSYAGGMLWLAALLAHNAKSLLAASGSTMARRLVQEMHRFPAHMPFPDPTQSLVWGIGLLLLGYFLYRLSLPSHRANGETFKSIFDLYRGRLAARLTLDSAEKERWEKAWAYLQYLRVECVHCGASVPAAKDRCITCSHTIADSLEDGFEPQPPATAGPRQPRLDNGPTG
jgi:hypothetical protein